ncbi:MAG: hypothetical protein M0Q00_00590 [Acholeplasmataceae bacterium]|nr:hypothetical protein [Acholeplasmataceae bacterium]
MNKLLDNVYKYSVWIVTSLAIIGYFAYKTLTFDGSIESVLNSWDTWTNLAFIIFLNITVQSGAIDSGISNGLSSEEFELADKLNNKIIGSVNNEMDDFRVFIKKLNKAELLRMQEDFLFAVGDKKVEDLSDKELKKFKKLKPIQHNVYGFNLPLFYELTRDGKINYRASFNRNKGRAKARIMKIVSGVMFGGLTINMAFNTTGLGEALVSVLIIGIGLMLTFVMSFVPYTFKLRFDLPKKVILKKTLYDSYIDYKTGSHKLVKVNQEVKLKDEVIEVVKPEETKPEQASKE